MRRSLRILALALLTVPIGVSARADVDPVVEMKEHFSKGQDFYEQKKFELAASEFRAAYEARPSASLLFNEAVCYQQLKNYAKAVSLFKEYLVKQPKARDREATEQRIATLEAAIQKKVPAPVIVKDERPRGFVNIESTPVGATVYLDDRKSEPLGVTPWNGPIEGAHKLIITAPGHKEVVKEINPDPNKITDVLIGLAQDQYLGFLIVRSNLQGADVYLDGKDAGIIGRTVYQGNITPGKHKVIVTKEGFTEKAEEINVVGGEVYKIDAMLEKAPIGFVVVSGATTEGGVVKLDGAVVCQKAPCRFQAPDGDHKVTIEKPGLKPLNKTLTIGKATETNLAVKLSAEQGHTDAIWKYAIAAAFLTGGIVLGVQANSIKSDIESERDKGMPPIGPDDDRFLKGKIFAWAADGCFVVGGVTAIIATIGLFTEKGPPSEGYATPRDLGIISGGTSTITPQVGPGYAGVSAEVRW